MNPTDLVTKVLIVEDHPLMREALALCISRQPDLEVCGEAESEAEALALIETVTPDLAIIDLSLKSGHGLELVKHIPKTKMLVVSCYEESLYAERVLRAGALGYLNKQESRERLVEAIHTVLAGSCFISPNLAQRLLNQSLGGTEQCKAQIERLGNRELEVFRLIGAGLTSGIIAERLSISTHTIDSHREKIKRKLGLANGAELNHAAAQWDRENG